MHKVIILGSGNIGFTVALLLLSIKDYEVTVVARNKKRLAYLEKALNVKTIQYDLENKKNFSKNFISYLIKTKGMPI